MWFNVYCALYCVNMVELVLLSLERGRLRKDLTDVWKYLKRGFKEDRAKLFPVVPSDRSRGSGTNLSTRKQFLARRAPKPWNILPREILDCWRYSKVTWTWSWAAGSRQPCWSRDLDQMTSRGHFLPEKCTLQLKANLETNVENAGSLKSVGSNAGLL